MKLLVLFSALCLLPSAFAAANEIVVTPEEVRLGDSIEITVRLQGEYAKVAKLGLPIRNLEIIDGPSTSAEFRWVNGVASRFRTFRYIARARHEGTAVVGPIDLFDSRGEPLHLPPVAIRVLPDSPPPNDPAAALQQAAGLFVTVEADQTNIFLGQQVNLTWTLYSRHPLRGFRLTSVPVLEKFWTEEIPQPRREVQQVVADGELLYKAVVRRVAVFPLEAGPVQIAPLETLAELIESDGFLRGFGVFERRVEEYRVRSGRLHLTVKPLPAGVAAIGDFSLECRPAVVPRTGPVRVDVILSGTGNVRAIDVPAFDSRPAAVVEVQSQDTVVDRATQPIRMSRNWRVLLFPRSEGSLLVPPLHFEYFDPASSQTRVLRCGEQQVAVTRQNTTAPAVTLRRPPPPPAPSSPGSTVQLPLAIGIVALAVTGVAWAGAMRRRGDTGLAAELARSDKEPREVRRTLHDAVSEAGLVPAELFREQSDLGDAFRAMHSLIDLMEKEPWEVPTAAKELRKRSREFARQLAKRARPAPPPQESP